MHRVQHGQGFLRLSWGEMIFDTMYRLIGWAEVNMGCFHPCEYIKRQAEIYTKALRSSGWIWYSVVSSA